MLMAQDPNVLIDAIKAIPDVIWGVIIGSLLTWVAVYLQLRHDSKEKRLSLIRDTYLSAAEKIGQQINYLANFHNTQINSPKGYVEAISNINILGKDETIKAVNNLNDYLNEALLELIPSKDRIIFLQQENLGLREGITSNFDKVLFQEHKKRSAEIQKLTSELDIKCQQKIQTAIELETLIIASIKKELELSFDEHAYREMMKNSHLKYKQKTQENIISRTKVINEFYEKWDSYFPE